MEFEAVFAEWAVDQISALFAVDFPSFSSIRWTLRCSVTDLEKGFAFVECVVMKRDFQVRPNLLLANSALENSLFVHFFDVVRKLRPLVERRLAKFADEILASTITVALSVRSTVEIGGGAFRVVLDFVVILPGSSAQVRLRARMAY